MLGLTPFGLLRFTTLTHTYSMVSYGNITFYLRQFFFFSNTTEA